MRLSRRDFLASTSAVGITACAAGNTALADGKSQQKVAFFVVGDTHYLANKESPGRMVAKSAEICGRLV